LFQARSILLHTEDNVKTFFFPFLKESMPA